MGRKAAFLEGSRCFPFVSNFLPSKSVLFSTCIKTYIIIQAAVFAKGRQGCVPNLGYPGVSQVPGSRVTSESVGYYSLKHPGTSEDLRVARLKY